MLRLSTDTPFVLLDDAREHGAAPARLYRAPQTIIRTSDPAQVTPCLEQLRASGRHAAGFLAYEAGHGLEPRLAPGAPTDTPLIWFGIFEDYVEIAPETVPALLPAPAGGWLGRPRPAITRADYATAQARVAQLIVAGDIYQANLTFGCDVSTAGDPLALYAGLRARARSGYGGIVWTGSDWLLSLSPELFFALQSQRLTTRPMKGTAARLPDPALDRAAAAQLAHDPKQRAENLMIVDLLRNDLSRVATPGSVSVPHLFHVESYPSVHQMTSTVSAQLRDGLDAVDVLHAIYPCGSITGAPKIRAMQVIAEVEAAPRGIYTGSIGRIDANGDAAFNVAIRTLHLRDGQNRARLGLGSGIVADSQVAEEWNECLAKGAFVADSRHFDLIETMRFEPEHGVLRLERHLARLAASASAFDFAFDRHAARNELQAATFRLGEPQRLRLLLARSGRMAIEIAPLPQPPSSPWRVALTPLPVSTDDFRLRHKTSDRDFYDSARKGCAADEVIFVDPLGRLSEGSVTNVFVPRGEQLLTPPLTQGLLGGVLRDELIESGAAIEAEVRAADLAAGFYVGNALRGLIAAQLV